MTNPGFRKIVNRLQRPLQLILMSANFAVAVACGGSGGGSASSDPGSNANGTVGNGSDNSAAGTTTIVSSPKGISLLAGSATSPGSKDGSLRVATFFEPGRMTADSQFACGQLNYGVGGIGRRWIARGLIFCHEHNNGRKGGAFVTVNK